MWAAIKNFIVKAWNNVVTAITSLTRKTITVDENGNSIIVETGLDLITGKFAAVVVVAAGLFFVLFPFNGTAQMAIGDQLIRVATIMWNGAP
jgi:hypothetical protein